MSEVATAAEFAGVRKTYPVGPWGRQRICALDQIDLVIGRGEVLGLVGPNRAGKTTLIKLLLGLCRPEAGRITRLGRPLWDTSTLARVGYVHEAPAFPRYLDARTVLRYHGVLGGSCPARVEATATEALRRVGLADRAHEPIARFSKGMSQRLGLAQALMSEPNLLVLDEPTEGLDLEGRRLLGPILQEVRQRGGSVLLISHLISDIERLCDRVAVLQEGRLVQVAAMEEITRDPRTSQARSLEDALLELTPIPDYCEAVS